MTETCFTNYVGWDFARNTAGYAIRGPPPPMRDTRWQPGSADRRTSSPSLRRCLAVYFMSNKATLMMDGVRAEVAGTMNPDARRHLSPDAVDALIRDDWSIRGEAEHLHLGLFWMSASGVITTWVSALLSSIVSDDQMQSLLWERWRADRKCRPITRDDGDQSYLFYMSTSPIIHGKGHKAMLHDSMRPQTSAGRHDLPPEGPGEANRGAGYWCNVHQESTMYVSCCTIGLPMPIRRVHCGEFLTTLGEMISWGVNGPLDINAVDSIMNASTCEHAATTCGPRSSRCMPSFAEPRAKARESFAKARL